MSTNTDQSSEERTNRIFHSSNLFVGIFAVFMMVGLATLAFIGRTPRSQMVGERLPRLDLQPLLNVEQPFSNEDLEGKLTVIHFWGTWCPPCQREFPEFVALAKEFSGNKDVAILSVSCSQQAELDLERLKTQTAQFMEKYSASLPTYSDATAMSRQQFAMLSSNGSFGYPTTVLADREGRIIQAIQGYYPGEMEVLADMLRDQL